MRELPSLEDDLQATVAALVDLRTAAGQEMVQSTLGAPELARLVELALPFVGFLVTTRFRQIVAMATEMEIRDYQSALLRASICEFPNFELHRAVERDLEQTLSADQLVIRAERSPRRLQ